MWRNPGKSAQVILSSFLNSSIVRFASRKILFKVFGGWNGLVNGDSGVGVCVDRFDIRIYFFAKVVKNIFSKKLTIYKDPQKNIKLIYSPFACGYPHSVYCSTPCARNDYLVRLHTA